MEGRHGRAPGEGAAIQLNLVGARTEHGSIGGLAAILVDGEDARVSPGALHGKSPVETGVRWVQNREEVPNARCYWVVWVAQGQGPDGRRGIRGAVASPMWIDREAMVGYKHLAGHVNDMSRALKGVVDLRELTPAQRRAVREAIIERAPRIWEGTAPEIRACFEGDVVSPDGNRAGDDPAGGPSPGTSPAS